MLITMVGHNSMRWAFRPNLRVLLESLFKNGVFSEQLWGLCSQKLSRFITVVVTKQMHPMIFGDTLLKMETRLSEKFLDFLLRILCESSASLKLEVVTPDPTVVYYFFYESMRDETPASIALRFACIINEDNAKMLYEALKNLNVKENAIHFDKIPWSNIQTLRYLMKTYAFTPKQALVWARHGAQICCFMKDMPNSTSPLRALPEDVKVEVISQLTQLNTAEATDLFEKAGSLFPLKVKINQLAKSLDGYFLSHSNSQQYQVTVDTLAKPLPSNMRAALFYHAAGTKLTAPSFSFGTRSSLKESLLTTASALEHPKP